MKDIFADAEKFGKITKLDAKFGEPSVRPPKGVHPRLMFTAETLEKIRDGLETEENRHAYSLYKELIETEFDGVITDKPTYPEFGKRLSIIECKALAYALTKEKRYAEEAIGAVANVILTATFDQFSDNYRAMGQVMLTAAEVYDWCYDVMPESAKEAFTAGCETILAPNMEIKFPPTAQGSISGHGSEAQLLRDWLSYAIASYDEYPDIYEFIGGDFFANYLPVRDYYYKSGAIHQGNNYGPYRFNFDLWSAWLFKRMTGKLVYDESMAKVMYGFIYGLRPDGQLLRVGDDWSELRLPYAVEYKITSFYAANLFGDEVVKGESKRLLDDYSAINWCNNTLTPAQYLIFNDTELKTRPLSELPLTYYMGSPLGETITRTGWDINHSDDILVMMKIGEHTGMNHDHLDSGNFQIYYKGILASESGVYDLYFTPEDKNYNKTTAAHNCMLIYDPDEDTSGRSNCGGQRYVSENYDINAWLSDPKYRYGKVLFHEETADHTVLSGDITSAYTDKVSEVIRTMVFLRRSDKEIPGIFVVYDRVTSSKAGFEKIFQLHTQEEPEIRGNISTLKNTKGKNHGALVNQTLLPENAKLSKVGGAGHEFDIRGTSYTSLVMPGDTNSTEAGWGRVEIRPESAALTDVFLNVMYVTDSENLTSVHEAELISGEGFVGAKLLDKAVIFADSRDITSFEFMIPGDAETDVILTGVGAGEWAVDGRAFAVGNDGATLSFRHNPGKVIVEKTR